MTPIKVLTHKRDIKGRLNSIESWKVDKQDKEAIKEFLEAYKQGEITGRIGTNIDATIERTIQYLKIPFEFISKKHKIGTLTKKELKIIQEFKKALLEDKIRSNTGKPFVLRSKKMILYSFGQFLKWKLNPSDYIELSKPLLIRLESKEKEPDSLNLEEIKKLYKTCNTDAQRFLIIVLFSSGTRAEEFHNIRYSDITMPKGEESFVKVRIRHGFSKTKGRTVTLYHPMALEVVRDYLELRKGCDPEEPLLKMSYNTGRIWLKRIGKRVLNRNVHYHLFRSSCATWLADRMNRQQLCIFFGWKFNSPMPDVYISRNGLDMKEIDKKFEGTEVQELRAKLEKESYQRKLDNEKLTEQDKKIKELVLKIDALLNGSYEREMKNIYKKFDKKIK